ncbi:MAG: tetratricopeptide repeat protein [Bacteroidota bacterium]
MRKSAFTIILFFSLFPFIRAGTVDSLLGVLKGAKSDSVKFALYNTIVRKLVGSDPDKAMQLSKEQLQLARDRSNKKEEGQALNNIGICYRYKGQYAQAVSYYRQALKVREEINDLKGIAASYNNIGLIYQYQSDYSQAIKHFLKTREILESMTDSMESVTHMKMIGQVINNIGMIYSEQNNHAKSMECFTQFLTYARRAGDKGNEAVALVNIGTIFEKMKEYEKAIQYAQQSLELRKQLGDVKGIADCYSNIGICHRLMGDNLTGLQYQLEALQIREEIKDLSGMAISYNNIGAVYTDLGQMDKGLRCLERGLELAREVGSPEMISVSYTALADAYRMKGDYKKAFEYYRMHSRIKDSILNEESLSLVQELEAKYQNEKNEAEIELLKKESEIKNINQQAALTKEKMVRNSFIAGFVILLVLAFMLYNRYQLKQKSNQELEAKNQLIEEKNKDITDSIKYAKRIQEAIFPPEETRLRIMPESFILYKPKDIVSGDFYWIEQWGNKTLFAAVDCTGHGVPGAFMSIVGCNLLNQAVNEHGISKPGLILNALNKGVSKTLRQKYEESSVKDGMDIALCSIDRKAGLLEFAGAYNSVYIVRNGQLNEINGDKFPVGIFFGEEMKMFSNHEVPVNAGDQVYVFSDGYADQFGGPSGKKFKYKRLKELILSVCDLSMEKQKEILADTIEKWRGDLEQVDDILVMGVRV